MHLLDIFEICQCNKGLMFNSFFIVDSLIIYDLYKRHLILESLITLIFILVVTYISIFKVVLYLFIRQRI